MEYNRTIVNNMVKNKLSFIYISCIKPYSIDNKLNTIFLPKYAALKRKASDNIPLVYTTFKNISLRNEVI